MEIVNHLNSHFDNLQHLNNIFVGTPPFPMIVLDNFLPNQTALDLEREVDLIPKIHWREFTRRGSFMQECNKMEHAPKAQNLVNQLHSSLGMKWLTGLTGIKDLLPDPYLTGAAYSVSFKNNTLKMHTDFNWNDQLKLHRMLSLIIYLNSEWKEEWGGHLNFNDFNNQHTVQSVLPKFNRAVIWRYHKRGFHGFPEPLNCPETQSRKTFRLFFYVSNSVPSEDDRPHRSLYWYDNELGEPYDIPTQR